MMNGKKFLLLCLVGALALFGADFKPVRANIPPVIDGELNDACWKDAQFYSKFYAYN